jgi:hypothetical protein
MFANLSVNCCGFDKYFSECFYKGLVPSVEVWEVLWTFKRWALWNVLGFIGSMTLKIFALGLCLCYLATAMMLPHLRSNPWIESEP